MPQTTRVLDAEWVEVTPEDGKVFYAHKPTNTTQWERPQLAAPVAAAPAQLTAPQWSWMVRTWSCVLSPWMAPH